MTIKQLRIKNFKSIRNEAVIDFGKLTFLYGPNSAGKSSVLDAIKFLSAIFLKQPISRESFYSSIHRFTNDQAAEASEGIRIALILCVGGLDLQRIGNAQFKDLENSLAIFAEGINLEIDVEIDRLTRDPVKELTISADGVPLITYQRTRTELGPFLQPASEGSTNDHTVRIITNLIGEWRIRADHPFGLDILTEHKANSQRASLAFSEDEHDGTIKVIRGIGICDEDQSPLSVQLHPESLDLVFPSAPELLLAEQEKMSALYRHPQKLDLDEHIQSPDHFCHKNFLKQFFGNAELSTKYEEYIHFLRSEFSSDNSNALRSDLQRQSENIDRFLAAVFSTVGKMLDIKRVTGNRSSFDSSQPLHLKSLEEAFFSKQPREIRPLSRAGFFYPGSNYPLHESSRQLGARTSHGAGDIPEIVAQYAEETIDRPSEKDFVNQALKNHLRSLSHYEITPEVFTLVSSSFDEHFPEDHEDFANSRLVYYTLKDKSGKRLYFSDVGSALGYVFPILAGLATQSALAIEQPELHLHPLAQDQLADVFIAASHRSKKDLLARRFIIESHSEVFLLKIAARIRQTSARLLEKARNVEDIAPELSIGHDEVRLYYFKPAKDGSTDIESIRFAEDGSLIESWPDGLFAKDWTSGLDRLKLFSKSYSNSDARYVWPWIDEVKDEQVAKWLRTAALLETADESTAELASIVWAKIAERVLLESLVTPIKPRLTESHIVLPKQYEKLEQGLRNLVFGKNRSPGLGWWRDSLVGIKVQQAREPQYFSSLRKHLEQEQFKNIWHSYPSGNLISLIGKLIRVRNPAAHNGAFDIELAAEARLLIADGKRPGILFHALGIIDNKSASGLRSVEGST